MKKDSTQSSLENRSEARHSRTIIAHIRLAGGAFEKAVLRNFSASGFQASTEFMPKTGDSVELRLANLDIFPGAVIWVRDAAFGVKLERPIDTDFLANR